MSFNPQGFSNAPTTYPDMILGGAPSMETFNNLIWCVFKSASDNNTFFVTHSADLPDDGAAVNQRTVQLTGR